MKKFWYGAVYLLVFSGYPLILWTVYELTTETYQFWRYGIETRASILAFDHLSRETKGGTTYYYLIETNGFRQIKDFRNRLPVGRSLSVLVLKDKPDQITLGSANNNLFELFSYRMGGSIIAVLAVVALVFGTVIGPIAIWVLIKAWKYIPN
jgi:hypothetical protein